MSIIFNVNNVQENKNIPIPKVKIYSQPIKGEERPQISEKTYFHALSFGAETSSKKIHTQLRTNEEKQKYTKLLSILDKKEQKTFEKLLRTGILLDNNANDNSTVLDNMYKIMTQKRAPGLNNKNIFLTVMSNLDNPYEITQKFGEIPDIVADEIIQHKEKYEIPNQIESLKQRNAEVLSKNQLNVTSSTCPAASIQFNLATKKPAEYVRIAEGLSSEKMSITKKIKTDDISTNPLDTLWLLNEFKTPYKYNSWNDITVEITPDKNALIRAQIQTAYKKENERSPIDVLMQSAFMNLASQKTYNTLTDIRTGHLNNDLTGLTDMEKTFAEILTQGKNKISVVYQKLDEDGKIVGYECKPQQTLKHISDSLKLGENVIIGYTHVNNQGKVEGGHEITIVGIETQKNGKKVFICNDTDDNKNHPIKYDVEYLLPKIHHAGIPVEVLANDQEVELVDNGEEILGIYKELVKNNSIQKVG